MTFKEPNKINNLPPGCSTSDLPGFTDQDRYRDSVEKIMGEQDCSFSEAEEILKDMEYEAGGEKYDELKEEGLI